MIGRGTLKYHNVKNLDEYWQSMMASRRTGYKGADWMFSKGNKQQQKEFLLSVIDKDRQAFEYFFNLL